MGADPLVAQVGGRRQEEGVGVRRDQPVALGLGEAEPHVGLVEGERDVDDRADPELPAAAHLPLVGPGQREAHAAYGARVGHASVTSRKSPAARRTGRSRADNAAELLVGHRLEREVGRHQVAGRRLHQVRPLRRDLGEHAPAVVGVGHADDPPVLGEPPDDRGHRRRVHLEPLTHLAQRQRAAGGEDEQHQGLVAREGQPVRLEDRVEPADDQLLDAHQRGHRVHRRHAIPPEPPLPRRLVDRVERQRLRWHALSIGAPLVDEDRQARHETP